MASDDSSELWLSTDDDPANKVVLASVNGWTGPEVWDKFTTQKSVAVSLSAGSVHYLEVLVKKSSHTLGDQVTHNFRKITMKLIQNTSMGFSLLL